MRVEKITHQWIISNNEERPHHALGDEMKRGSQEIAHDAARMRAAEREGFAPEVKTSSARPSVNAGVTRAKGSRKTKDRSGEPHVTVTGHQPMIF